MRLLPICKQSLTRREKKFIVDSVAHWSRMMILTIILRVYDLYNHYFQECRRCHQEMEEVQSKAIQKTLQQLAANSESSIYEDFLLHVPTIYREISQQVADQLEKKDFSPWHGAKMSLWNYSPTWGAISKRHIIWNALHLNIQTFQFGKCHLPNILVSSHFIVI